MTFSPRLIISKDDYHFAALNQLQSVWQNYDRVKNAIENNRNNGPRLLLNAIDAFKSLGFDHVRHSSYELFAEHWRGLENQGMVWKLNEQQDDLIKLGVLESSITSGMEIPQPDNQVIYDAFFEFWRDATKQLIGNATFTLEDQKYFAYIDERQKIEERRFLSGGASYDHVLVDEFQDINPLDLALVKAIAERNRATVTVAGDDDQAIFEWRGATPEYILAPERFFGTPFKTYKLEVNYRSPSTIVDMSQNLIAHNHRRVDKSIKASHSDYQAQVEIREIDTLGDSLEYVYKMVENSINQGSNPSHIAIIGRKRSQIIPYQVFFASKDIPFCAAEDLQVFLGTAFNRLLELLMIKVRANTSHLRTQVVNDLIALCDLIKRYPLNRNEKSSLQTHIQRSGSSTVASATDALIAYRGRLKGANADGNMSLQMATAIREFVDADSISAALLVLSNLFEGLQFDLGKAEDDIFYTDPPFLYLSEYASDYGDDYDRFIGDIERAKDQLVYVPPFNDDGQDGTPDELWKRPLHLMTALRAKGKEFDSVILLDVIEGIWPNRNAQTEFQLEAERRVFYVAFTRARQKVVMLVNSRVGNTEAVPSRYISELGLST